MADAVRVHVDMSGLRRFVRSANSAREPFRWLYKQWAARYSADMRRKFVESSKGSGPSPRWKPLHPSTIERRRGSKYKRGSELTFDQKKRIATGKAKRYKRRRKPAGNVKILRDTGTLLRALTVGAPGNMTQVLRNGVRFGFGGGAGHPDAKGLTIAEIAKIHNAGDRKARIPQRLILRPVDGPLMRRMQSDLRRAIQRYR